MDLLREITLTDAWGKCGIHDLRHREAGRDDPDEISWQHRRAAIPVRQRSAPSTGCLCERLVQSQAPLKDKGHE